MQNKYIDTPQAVEGESKNLPHFNSYTYFKQQLMIKNVDAIFDNPRVSIKKDKDRYIFNIDKQNAFTIAESNIERRVRQYCQEKETRKTQEDVLIKITGLKIEYIKSTTQDELDVLKVDINKQKTSEQRETNIENIKFKIERNIKFLEQEKDDSKKAKKDDKTDRLLRKSYISQVQDRLDRLYRMKSRVELIDQHQNEKYKIKRETVNGKREIKEVEMGDINDFDKNETLKQLNEWIEDIGNEQSDFIATRNSIISKEAGTVPYYEIIINDKKDARQIQKTLKKLNNQYVILNTISLDAAKKQELAQDLQDLEVYLNKVIDNPDTFKPSENPFIPKHKDEFFKLVENDETLSKLFILNKTKTVIPTENKPTTETESQGQSTGTENTDKKKTGTEKAPNTYANIGEAFEKGGINGVSKYRLDQTNMKPEQKQFRGGVGNLAVTGGIVFLGWKMVSSAFKMIFKSKKGEKPGEGKGIYDSTNRAWLGIPAAVLFGSQARTGEGPMGLLKGGAISGKLANIFGRGNGTPDTSGEAKQEDVYKEGFIGLMGAFDMMNYQGMASILEKTSEGKMKIKEDQYDGFVKTLEAGNDNQKAGAKFIKQHVGKTDKNGWMDLTLRSMGIASIEDLTKDPTRDFKETAADAATRLFSVGKFMEDKGYLRINPETMSLITAYVADPKGTIDDLQKLADRGDVFETTETVTDKTGLAAKIKLIANTDTEKERLILKGLNTFYESWPTADKTGLDIIGTGPIVEFKTYGYTTKIDMDNKKMEGLNTQTKFDSYMEMFKAANLTNRIQVICKDKQAVSDKPFYLSTPGSDITFDNAKIFSTDFDTEIMTAGRGGELQKVSSTLEKYKKEYCDYLNSITPKFWKEQAATTNSTTTSTETVSAETVTDKTGLATKIKLIAKTDTEKERLILNELNSFYDYWPTADKTGLDIIGTGPIVEFKTYGYTTKIDMDNKKMEGLNTQTKFDSYMEMFKAANLTNRIKVICKDKQAVSDKPFYLSTPGGDITFDNAKIFSTDFDTEIMTAGRGGELRKVSSTLEKHKKEYCDYLNSITPKFWKEVAENFDFDKSTNILTIGDKKFSVTSEALINNTWVAVTNTEFTGEYNGYLKNKQIGESYIKTTSNAKVTIKRIS